MFSQEWYDKYANQTYSEDTAQRTFYYIRKKSIASYYECKASLKTDKTVLVLKIVTWNINTWKIFLIIILLDQALKIIQIIYWLFLLIEFPLKFNIFLYLILVREANLLRSTRKCGFDMTELQMVSFKIKEGMI